MGPKKARMVYDQSWSLKYAMEVTERSSGGAVTSTICLFCKFHGRQLDMVGRQRAARKGPQYHTSWRTDLFMKHLTNQHADLWDAYQNESIDGKKAFFKGRIALSNTLHNYWDLTGDVLEFSMSSETVEVVIAELMFRPEDEMAALDNDMDESAIAVARASPAGIAQLKRNALLLFNVQEDGSYKTTIKNVDRFKLAIKLVSHGLSFRQTANAMEAVRATFNLSKLTGINDNMVGRFVRVLVGVSIQKIGDLLATDDVWTMSIGFDGSSHRGTTFFDLRVRLGVKGVLHNILLIAMPHFDRHTANHQVAMLKKLLSAVYPSWADKLLAPVDGSSFCVGSVSGWLPRSSTRRRSSPTFPFSSGRRTRIARTSSTSPWRASSRRSNSTCWARCDKSTSKMGTFRLYFVSSTFKVQILPTFKLKVGKVEISTFNEAWSLLMTSSLQEFSEFGTA